MFKRDKRPLLRALPALAFVLFSYQLPSQAQGQNAPSIPSVIHETEGRWSGTWTLDNGRYEAQWNNGAKAALTIGSFTSQSVLLNRTDPEDSGSRGLTAVYTGQIASTGDKIVNGHVTWTWPGVPGYPTTGTWNASWARAVADVEILPTATAHAIAPTMSPKHQVTIAVVLDQEWTDTGVYLTQGQSVKVVAHGTLNWYTGACNGKCLSTPAGISCPGGGPMRLGLPCLSLLGQIGKSGRPFEVGESTVFTAPASGEFFLGINDDYLADNTGTWTANISSTSDFVEIKARQQTTLSVALDRPWIDTGVYLAQGQSVTIAAQGIMDWYTGFCDGKCLSTPAGIPCPGRGPKRLGLTCLSLIAVVGASGRPFDVGDSLTFTAPAAGELFLGVNDDNFADNTGTWTATISSPIAFVQWAQTNRVHQQLLAQEQRNHTGISSFTKGLIFVGGIAVLAGLIFNSRNSAGEISDSDAAQRQERYREGRQRQLDNERQRRLDEERIQRQRQLDDERMERQPSVAPPPPEPPQ